MEFDRKIVRAWCMYDWANSAYVTTTAAALFPVYFVQGVAPQGATVAGKWLPASALWGYGVGLAALLVLILAPVLGAMADYTCMKKRMLMVFALVGSFFASLLYFATPGAVWYALGMFVLAQFCFVAGNVFYDAFLPQIVPEHLTDRISGLGYAYGYVGGGLQFALALVLVARPEWFGLEQTMAVRLGILMAGLWWGLFSLYTFRYLPEFCPEGQVRRTLPLRKLVRLGFERTWHTARQLPRFRPLLLFLIAFLFYNDGIQTVISVASAYGGSELRLSPPVIMLTFLIVQFVAYGGARFFSWLAERMGTKRAIILTLICWTGVVTYGYFLRAGDVWGFLGLGLLVGLVLGGSQALSRSFYAQMIPAEASAEFFGFFSVFNKLSAVMGPLLFGTLTAVFGSARPAILSFILFFVIGIVLLLLVDVARGRADRHRWRFQGETVSFDGA